jgi:pimeloyl-ACP methyl ester carboxylesterase
MVNKSIFIRVARRIGLVVGVFVYVVALVLVGFRIAADFRETDDGHPNESRLVATPLGVVAVQVSGPADGPPVVLVHGTAGWSGFWGKVSEHLAVRGWRVIAVDMPPFGYSEHDEQRRYDRVSQASRLAAVLQHEARQPAIVVGHSFGAGAVAELALRAPQQVHSVVFVDAALGRLDVSEAPGALDSVLQQSLIAEPIVSASMTNPMAIGALLRSMLARKDAAAPWLDTIRQPMRRRGTTAAYAAWLPALFATDDGALSRRSEALRGIAVPVSLIWGEADTVTPIAQGETLAQLTKARSFARLPGVGHIPHIEDETGFLAALDAALAEP